MEKVENLYCSARAKNVAPGRLHHMVETCDRNASSFRDLESFGVLSSELISEQSIAPLMPA